MSWRRMGSSLGVKVREHRLLTLIRSTMSEDTPLLVDAAGARLLGEVHETSFDRGPADIDDQVRLKVGSHAQVIRMTRVRTQAGVPFMIEAVRMPAELLQGIGDAELSRSFLTQWALTGGVELGAAEEVVSAGTASPEACSALGLEPGAPVLVLERVINTRRGRPAQWRRAECHKDRARFQVRHKHGLATA